MSDVFTDDATQLRNTGQMLIFGFGFVCAFLAHAAALSFLSSGVARASALTGRDSEQVCWLIQFVPWLSPLAQFLLSRELFRLAVIIINHLLVG
ncbi:hypothetical protein ACR9HV_09450 [Enterobacter ludwigii]